MVAEPVKRPQNCGTGYCSCIECPYEPVKQEPAGWRYHNGETMPLYSPPVDAKAIRVEALEEAVKLLEENGMIAPNGFTAAAIRRLK